MKLTKEQIEEMKRRNEKKIKASNQGKTIKK